jgi:hypothetical protein
MVEIPNIFSGMAHQAIQWNDWSALAAVVHNQHNSPVPLT